MVVAELGLLLDQCILLGHFVRPIEQLVTRQLVQQRANGALHCDANTEYVLQSRDGIAKKRTVLEWLVKDEVAV